MKITRIILVSFLITHVIWVCIHMTLHANDKVNPWKGGGYAMYTIPTPKPQVFIDYEISDGVWERIDPSTLYLFNRQRLNHNYYCKLFSQKDLLTLVSIHPELIGRDTEIVFTKWVMNKFPITMHQEQYAGLRLFWGDDNSYNYIFQNCDGKLHGGGGIISFKYEK